MPAHVTHPTPYPDVNAVLYELLSGVQAILGKRFVGMYLYGSLASGDFDPRRSDIDFVVVTAEEVSDEVTSALEELHARMTASGMKWAPKLEGSYIPQQALRRYDPTAAPCPQVNEGRFYVARHGSDWVIQRHILRGQGVAVTGPALKPLIDPVQPDDLRRAVRGVLYEWWAPMLENPTRLHGREYQAYATLTMCRALYTLRTGAIVSKTAAARWAQETLGERWTRLIERALAWPRDPQPDDLAETLAFIRYTLARSQPRKSPADEG